VRQKPEAESPHADRQPPKGMRVLIVEDNADSREMLCELLRRVGCECHAFETGVQALQFLENASVDIAFLDLGLPGMDGYEVAKKIRANHKHAEARVVALTGYGQASDRARTIDAGFDEHLIKPVNVETLLELLAKNGETSEAAAKSA
jgi:two-component system CheB/CheR fusion protein